MIDIYEEIVKIMRAGEEAALVTVVKSSGSTPREEGSKMLVRTDGNILGSIGGGVIESHVCKKAREVIEKGKPLKLLAGLNGNEYGGGETVICGGQMEVFIEPIIPPPGLFIFGGGHIALPLSRIAKISGFRVVLIDDRAEFANSQRFPEADLIIAEHYDKAFSTLKIGESSYIVIITRGHKYDEQVLKLSLGTRAGYIGMIGSRKKIDTIYSHLLDEGVSQEQINKVHAPIGIDINAETPEEIAISIIAEVIKVKRSS
ncbi:XdhC family protein [Chloroflexota bacterium]